MSVAMRHGTVSAVGGGGHVWPSVPNMNRTWPPAPNRQLCAHVAASGWGVSESHAPPSGPLSVRLRSPVHRDCCSMGSVMSRPGCAGVGPARGSRPGNRSAEHEVRLEARSEDVLRVGDNWSKQPVAPSAESGVDQGADTGAAVGSLVWRPVGKARLVRSLGVILRRWGGPAVAGSAGEAAAPGARTFGAVCAPRSS